MFGRFLFVSLFLLSVVHSKCVISGCSGEICADSERVSDCLFQPWGQCYPLSHCAELEDGSCGWTSNELFRRCIYRNGCECSGDSNPRTCSNGSDSVSGEVCFVSTSSECSVQNLVCPVDDDDEDLFTISIDLPSSVLNRYSSILSILTGATNFLYSSVTTISSDEVSVRTDVIASPSSSGTGSTLIFSFAFLCLLLL